MMNIAIFEEDACVNRKILEKLTELFGEKREEIRFFCFLNLTDTLSAMKENSFSFVFFSLSAFGNNPFLFDRISLACEQTKFILLTASPRQLEMALRCSYYHLVRLDFLEQDLAVSVSKIKREISRPLRSFLFATSSGRIQAKIRDILFVESNRHTITVHTVSRCFTVTQTLSELAGHLLSCGFVQSHKSYLVNLYHIEEIRKDTILLDNGEVILLSRYRSAEVHQRMEHYLRKMEWID